ncbi:superfamily I DNA/RNA helicase/RecB family exonuclease [Microbacteriaceae bacterium SG_E_30_P1]|uniref:DNA 3'-5' helicase n=1 Tax=Antiquaquibacter oligotrophicus TaxID=2880260 RepID=A0ABT6KK91_9MICO|nr:ATP-dependent DNA helicase [Antiquaquibacter oligotrophicus]MDH6180427.1 superfamily I DNA/RNA helicase/RecB family exonuclease [Antiquaquibacter oligotrophicus]UDF13835.1 ATP-dependent helicase [Antiquaquibacter oligotrophicus]
MTITGFRAPSGSENVIPELDESQRGVLDLDVAASAAVLGAPGTGKTTTLVELVADRVIGRGWGPDAVLALTTSRATATRLRDALALRLSLPTTGALARSVNSLAFEIVRDAARAAGEPPPRLVSGGEQDAELASLLEGHILDGGGPEWPESLGPEVRQLRRFRTELRELMTRATEHDVRPEQLRRLGDAHGHPEWRAAADLIEEYEQVLSYSSETRLDQAELVRFAVAAIRRGDGGERVAALRLVVIDDLQEATETTLSLLAALAERGIAVVAFGDPDVAANAFRGGEPDALGRLSSVLGVPAETLVLSTSYRHGMVVRGLLGAVTKRIGAAAAGRQRRATAGGSEPEHPVVRVEAPSVAREWATVARILREEHLRRGVPYRDMAVIVRSGAQIAAAERALAFSEVPTRTTVGGRALRDDAAARALLRVVQAGIGHVELTPELATELLLSPFGGLDRLGLRRLRIALRAEEVAGGGTRPADDLVVEALAQPGRFVTIDHRVARIAERLAETLAQLRSSDGSIEELLWLVWERSRLARTWYTQALSHGIAASEANRNLDGIVALFTSAKRFAETRPGDSPRLYLDDVLGAEVPEDTLSPQSYESAVLLTTPSATVGLEFDTVVVGGLQDGVWPNLRLRGSLLAPQQLASAVMGVDAEAIDERRQVLGDELRMFALAVSRARHRVVLAAVANDDEAPSVLLGLAPDAPALDTSVPPMTLRAQVGRLRQRLARNPADSAAANTLAALAVEGVPGAEPDEWLGLLDLSTEAPLFEDSPVPVSPSAIESLLASPLDWFLDRVAGSESGVIAGVGTIIHWAMETADDITVDALWEAVEKRWSELLFDAPWLADRQRVIARGFIEALAEYLADFRRDGKTLVGKESRFTLEVGRALLSGSIDRVERTRDGDVVIVDLKTGTPETRAAAIAEHPQLGAYQLAYSSGLLDEALAPHGEHRAGGAKLLYVKQGIRGRKYREATQSAFDAEALEKFRQRVEAAAALIAAAEFVGPVELDTFRSDTSRLRLHRVREVSSD